MKNSEDTGIVRSKSQNNDKQQNKNNKTPKTEICVLLSRKQISEQDRIKESNHF